MARQTRPCMAGCKPDQAPKHQVAIADGTMGGTSIYWHFDCHVIATDCEVCQGELDKVGTDATSKGLKNEKLVDALVKHYELDKSEEDSK